MRSYIRGKTISSIMRNLNIALLCLLAFSLVVPSLALTGNETIVTFDNLQAVTDSDLVINGLNVTSGQYELLAIYNTSSTGIIFQPGMYTILIKTHPISRLTDLPTFASGVQSYFETHSTIIIVFTTVAVAILLVVRRRR